MPKLAPGLYDLPITVDLQRALEDLGRERLASSYDDPDAADSHDLLGRHLAAIVRQVLLTIRPEERLQRAHSPPPASSRGARRSPPRSR